MVNSNPRPEPNQDLVDLLNTANSVYYELRDALVKSKIIYEKVGPHENNLHKLLEDVFDERVRLIAEQWFDAHLPDVESVHEGCDEDGKRIE